MKQNKLLKNTIIVIFTSLIVKMIGIIGKILSTRILGLQGMSKYALSYPTLLLFINIAGFSMNTTISKLVSEATATKNYSPKILLKKGIKTSLLISIICIIVYLCSIKTISIHFLKDSDLFYPLLVGTFLIPLVGISDALRGYFNGIKEVKIASTSLFLEQLFRTTSSIIGIFIGIKYSVIVATAFLYIALSIGELASIVYCLINLWIHKPIHYDNTSGEQTIITKTASYLTASRIIGSISYFLEPILYTNILTYLNYNTDIIHNTYTTIDVYTIPLLTIISFIPFSLSTAIVPHISESYAQNNQTKLHYYIHKAYLCTIFSALVCLITIYFYHNELMNILYKTTTGATLAKNVSLVFIFYYIQIISSSILHAIGEVKIILTNSILNNILRLLLIIILPFFPTINVNSILYATIISSTISSIILLIKIFKKTKLKLELSNIFNIILILLITFFSYKLLIFFNVNFIISIIIILIFNCLCFIKLIRKKL